MHAQRNAIMELAGTSPCRLSESPIWDVQRRYFRREGIEAWRTSTVPHYITCNAALARAYANVVVGVMRDHAGRSPGADEPVHIVELGAGSGRFGSYFLTFLTEILASSSLAGLRFKYVMTDLAESTVEFWRTHPALQPFVERGVLELAWLDACAGLDRALSHELQRSRAPLVVIANYVFDGLPQDAFAIRDHVVHEYRRAFVLAADDLTTARPDQLAARDDLFGSFAVGPPVPEPYAEPVFNQILADYACCLDDTIITFPSAALRCLARLAAVAPDRDLVVVSADRGYSSLSLTPQHAAPDLGCAGHGSLSLPVNYHAIVEYVRRCGGAAIAPRHHTTRLHPILCMLPEAPGRHVEARLAFAQWLDGAGADDQYTVGRKLRDGLEALSLEALLALLRVSQCDPRVLLECVPFLCARAPSASDALQADLLQIIERAWALYYHFGEAADLAFELGALLLALARPVAAASFFEHSLRLHGPAAATWWNLGICHYHAGELDAGAAACAAALQTPGFRPNGCLVPKYL